MASDRWDKHNCCRAKVAQDIVVVVGCVRVDALPFFPVLLVRRSRKGKVGVGKDTAVVDASPVRLLHNYFVATVGDTIAPRGGRNQVDATVSAGLLDMNVEVAERHRLLAKTQSDRQSVWDCQDQQWQPLQTRPRLVMPPLALMAVMLIAAEVSSTTLCGQAFHGIQ